MIGDHLGKDWIEVRRVRDRAEAEQFALVLAAAGIDSAIAPGPDGLRLIVSAADAANAVYELDAYRRDGQRHRRRRLPLKPAREAFLSALVFACVLFFVEGAAGRQLFGLDWYAAGSASAAAILGGEWWRVVTALGLHADFQHIAANLLAGGLLGVALAQVLGGGLAWLLILAAGGLGNALNAVFHGGDHISIGASTAVFGAVGILAAITTRHRRAEWHRGLRPWVPLAVGLMLFAFFGVNGERTDIGAHLFGLVAGVGIGGLLALVDLPSETPRPLPQMSLGLSALALFFGAWALALLAAA